MRHKAVIMAGGCGTRGRPYTDYIPKAAIPVNGIPAIARVASHLAASPEIGEIIVLADYTGLGSQIRNYFGTRKVCGKPVKFVQDSQSGTGGDLLHLRGHLGGGKGDFILWFADNICALDAGSMLASLGETETQACVAVRSCRKEETGFARVEGQTVTEFVEKPTVTLPLKECIGVYALSQKVLGRILTARRKKPKVDLSYDILGRLASEGKVCAYDIGKLAWVDAESPAILERKSKTVSKALREMAAYAAVRAR